MSGSRRDLSHIYFGGSRLSRQRVYYSHPGCVTTATTTAPALEESLDEFISWVLKRAGLDPAAYRTQSLHRRLPACLRAMKVCSTSAARELLERKPQLVPKAIGSLLIGVTEFFREPGVFDCLRAGPACIGQGQQTAASLERRMFHRRRTVQRGNSLKRSGPA